MSVFISYSHNDKRFVDRLAAALIRKRQHIWLDRYELRPGDSLLQRIQDAIEKAQALLVVLSKASVNSEWCKKELSVGLVRELEEKRVVVIPVLMEDCSIPLLLRDKLCADFRISFKDGINDVIQAIATVTSDSQGRLHSDEFYTDWAMDWFYEGEDFVLRFTIAEHYKEAPVTVLTVIRLVANEAATKRYRRFEHEGFGWFGRTVIVEMLSELGKRDDLFLRLEDQMEKNWSFTIRDTAGENEYKIQVSSRRLGEDTGKDILVDFGSQLMRLREAVLTSRGKMSQEESAELVALLAADRLAANSGPQADG
jgi:hypothetical protein